MANLFQTNEELRKFYRYNLGGYRLHEDYCTHYRQSFNGVFWECKDCGKRMTDGK